MLAKVKTCAVTGIEGRLVEVEVQVRTAGVPRFTIIGLGDSAVRESRDRVLSAIRHSGFFPPEQILVNLAPAEIRKEGSSFDLPIALGILAASGQVAKHRLLEMTFHGELSLDGRIKPVQGMLSLAVESAAHGVKEVVVPYENRDETSLVSDLRVTAAASLVEVVGYLNRGVRPLQPPPTTQMILSGNGNGSISEVWGQESAKRAMVIAAAGGHNLLMIGPPGCGKSMLAARFTSLLPPLNNAELLEAVKIHSIAGLPVAELLGGRRPFRSPHHVVSDVGLIGGGPGPKPGEISMAHHGVLFLDEFPEFRRSALESLRAPLETGQVRVTRAKASVVFPARFQLVAAMNPCPCGRLGGAVMSGQKACLCSRGAIAAYLRKLSQPILDRIDMHVELEAVPFAVMVNQTADKTGEKELALREAVCAARERQFTRQGGLNCLLGSKELFEHFQVPSGTLRLLEEAAGRHRLSARSYVRVLRMAATIADLDQSGAITREHIAEALGFRGLERLQRYAEESTPTF